MKQIDRPALALVTRVALVTLLYGMTLYFRAATASLHDGYQPGIEALRLYVNPGLQLGLITAGAVTSRSAFPARVAVHACLAAIATCALMLAVVSSHPGNRNTWVFPQQRSLESTVHTALFTPNFSGRSKSSIAGSAIVALCWLGVSSCVFLRRKRAAHTTQSIQPG